MCVRNDIGSGKVPSSNIHLRKEKATNLRKVSGEVESVRCWPK